MIKHIIIADDSEYKKQNIIEYLSEIFPDADVTEFSCSNEIRYYMCYKHYDKIQKNPDEYLVVTDMVMPALKDGYPEKDEGFFVLAEMHRREMTSPAIVVSSDKIDDERGKSEYDYYLGSVEENPTVYTLPLYEEVLKSIIE